MSKAARWQQRYENFDKAVNQLTRFLAQKELNILEKQGLIQCFEYTFELGWKTAKDYLEAEGFQVRSPRETIQQAFQMGLIADGHGWIDALEKRNLMSHTYDEALAEEVVGLIRERYAGLLQQLHKVLKGVLPQ